MGQGERREAGSYVRGTGRGTNRSERVHDKCFPCTVSSNLHNIPYKQEPLPPPFHRWGNSLSETMEAAQVKPLAGRKARIWTQGSDSKTQAPIHAETPRRDEIQILTGELCSLVNSRGISWALKVCARYYTHTDTHTIISIQIPALPLISYATWISFQLTQASQKKICIYIYTYTYKKKNRQKKIWKTNGIKSTTENLGKRNRSSLYYSCNFYVKFEIKSK